tara:strand:+ start:1428 stop:1589 length:162 start_codon:yes stop_codon:yes gene_type:complete
MRRAAQEENEEEEEKVASVFVFVFLRRVTAPPHVMMCVRSKERRSLSSLEREK